MGLWQKLKWYLPKVQKCKNGAVGFPKILFFYKAMTKWEKIVKINAFSKFLKLKACSNQGSIYLRKRANHSKNSDHCGILTCPIPSPSPNSMIDLISSNPAATGGKRIKLKLPHSLISRDVRGVTWHLFGLSGGILEVPNLQGCLYLNWLGAYPYSWGHLSKIFRGNCLTLRLPEVVDNIWGKK